MGVLPRNATVSPAEALAAGTLHVVARQAVVSTCEQCTPTADTCLFAGAGACARRACAAWQKWTLASPVAAETGMTMVWRVHNLTPLSGSMATRAVSPVVGVAPAAENQGGPSSLPVNPNMHMRFPMAQYAFRTLMAGADDDHHGDGFGTGTTATPSHKVHRGDKKSHLTGTWQEEGVDS